MPFQWGEYLHLAEYLKNNESRLTVSPEAASRCATSRAYYAAFRHALDFARTHHGYKRIGSGKDHRALIEHYDRVGLAQISMTLDQLRQWRNQCDYDDTVHNCRTMRDWAIDSAEYIIRLLS